ncbi:hypothetical protein APHAL10511_004477 [Amanita phalloides]|nr:hypothetical protein APHAL10511_004477 [Amanita phalloides]
MCGHPWWQHKPLFPQLSGHGACITSNCGLYYPQDMLLTAGTCICDEPRNAHVVLSEPGITSPAALARNPPVHAYRMTGVPSHSTIILWSSHCVSTTASTIANNEHHEAAACHHSPNTRPWSQIPPTIIPHPLSIQLNCGIWPFVIDKDWSYKGHQPPEPVFNQRELSKLVNCLQTHHLVFQVAVERAVSNPWKTIDAALGAHLKEYFFELARDEKDDGTNFYKLSWDILGRKKNKGSSAKVMYQVGLVGLEDFTFDFVCGQALPGVTTPDAPFILLAPTIGNLWGPIPVGNQCELAHACLPWCMLAPLTWLKLRSNREGEDCIEGMCPELDLFQSLSPMVPDIYPAILQSPS